MAPLMKIRSGKPLAGEDGGILIEFALIFPLMLLIFTAMVESARMMMTYQTAVAGVRDAGRYFARVLPVDICNTGGSVASYTSTLRNIIENDLSGQSLFPSGVTIDTVVPSYNCVAGSYRVSPAPVGVVTATMTINFPATGIMDLFGGGMSSVTATIADQSRVFGN